ncbi:MAG: hypothetical protein CMJ78_04015 [Planctomycetaceae bacterium]|nr:hypothetical protein [Planctomycetaceae bacterium]
MAVVACSGSGCKVMCHWMPQASFCQPTCVLPPEASLSQVITHLNTNIAAVNSWQSTDMSIRARQKGLPVWLSGNIAVASPRNFRLSAGILGQDAVEIGSNDNQLWFSSRETQGKVLTVGHDDISRVQHRLPIPFQPDWIIAALGVIPLNEREYEMTRTGDGNEIRLVAHGVTPAGETVQRLIVVDACRGVIMAHALYNGKGNLIAKATFGDHQLDVATGVVLPHRISLDWPEADVNLAMKLGVIEINPEILPNWSIPSNQEVINLSQIR